jgi:hypothetical protein
VENVDKKVDNSEKGVPTHENSLENVDISIWLMKN